MKFTGFIIFVLLLGASYNIVSENFLRSDEFERIPAQSTADVKITKALEKIKNIYNFQTANQILAGVTSELKEINTPLSKSLAEVTQILFETEGLLYRFEPVIKKSKFASLSLITALKEMKLTTPKRYTAVHTLIDRLFIEVKQPRVEDIEKLQQYLISDVVPKLEKLRNHLTETSKKYPLDNGIQTIFRFDFSSLLPKSGSFLPDEFKLLNFSSADVYILKAELEYFIAKLHYISSYDIKKYPELMFSSQKAALGHAGVIGLGRNQNFEDSNRYSKVKFHEKVKKDYYRTALTLHNWAIEQNLLTKSREWLLRSYSSSQDAVVVAKQIRQSNKLYVAQELVSKYARNSQAHYELAYSFLSNNEASSFTDPLTGENFKINPSQIFSNQTKDLKDLFPSGHDLNRHKTIHGEKIINLEYGKANAWNDLSFAGVLPDANGDNLTFQMQALGRHPATMALAHWLLFFQ